MASNADALNVLHEMVSNVGTSSTSHRIVCKQTHNEYHIFLGWLGKSTHNQVVSAKFVPGKHMTSFTIGAPRLCFLVGLARAHTQLASPQRHSPCTLLCRSNHLKPRHRRGEPAQRKEKSQLKGKEESTQEYLMHFTRNSFEFSSHENTLRNTLQLFVYN